MLDNLRKNYISDKIKLANMQFLKVQEVTLFLGYHLSRQQNDPRYSKCVTYLMD